MKNREGFVSNSSSSSFIAWGITLDKDDFFKLVHQEFPNIDIDEAKEEWDLCDIGYGNYPEEIKDWDLVQECSNFDYGSDEFHFGYEWDVESSSMDLTKPLVSPEKQVKIQQLAKHYNLGAPRTSGGTRYC